MSRIGKQPIAIPDKTEVTVSDHLVTVKGPQGELSRVFRPDVSIEVKDGAVVLDLKSTTQAARMLWGTYASHIRNMVAGVNEKYVKKLIIEGVGFRAAVEGKKLVMQLGFSHPVELEIPDDLEVLVEKELVTVSGINKESVGHFASVIRSQKKPEPYKGKGIRYEDEVIRRKQGKRAVGTE